jgi:hypothetical protein
VNAVFRQENASKQKTIAFSSEVDAGSREENASKQKRGAFARSERPFASRIARTQKYGARF